MKKTNTTATRKKTVPAKILKKPIPAEILKKTIVYFYLLSYCPPERIVDFKRISAPMRKDLAARAGMPEAAYFKEAAPEVCRRIVAYQQNTREPDAKLVEALTEAASNAGKSPDAAAAFQARMTEISALPGRAKLENRLHRNKGCQFCESPCRYGYFTLVSEPRFDELQRLLEAETQKPADLQTPLYPAYGFAVRHMINLTGAHEGITGKKHLANLSYCLLMLAMAKSRQTVPEQQLRMFQAANREFIRR